ncbi:lymphocyte antigen 6 complex locus protein G6c [Carettochelys insculpta]|uniref:lymphocyte antigen 6 complex locus protein G6c n=1 Tax=Carettochelys insculpta TaxID=44489 RepID=UPI003EC012C2
MSRVLLLPLALLLLWAQAEALICRVCKFKVGAMCFRSEQPCRANPDEYCDTTKAYLGQLPLFSKFGCSRRREHCNVTEKKDDIFEISYNRTCCETDLCNAAGPGPQVAGLLLLPGLGALLGWGLLR